MAIYKPEGLKTFEDFQNWWKQIPNVEPGYNGPGIPTWNGIEEGPGEVFYFSTITIVETSEEAAVSKFADAIYAYLQLYPNTWVRVRVLPEMEPETDFETDSMKYRLRTRLLCSAALDASENRSLIPPTEP
jgi:hypothetical protein